MPKRDRGIRTRPPSSELTVALIEDRLPIAARSLLLAGRAAAEDLGMLLWIVGGAIRDALAGRPLRDVDVALDGDPRRLAEATARAVGVPDVEVRFEPRFLTAGVIISGARLDVARLRVERYRRPGALPIVAPSRSIEADLARRDFTVNAMALGATGDGRDRLVDPWDGLGDLRARRLRTLHEASFRDDATRLWRGARFAAALRLRPDAETAHQIAAGTRWLAPISSRRLWAELERTAAQRRLHSTLQLLDAWGVLEATHPALTYHGAAAHALRHRPGPHEPSVLLAVLLASVHAAGREAALERLAPPREARTAVHDAARLREATAAAGCSPEALEALTRAGDAGRTAARWLAPREQRPLQRALRRWERTRPPLDARALRGLGMLDGPRLGAMLLELRRARFLGTLTTTRAAREYVRAEQVATEDA